MEIIDPVFFREIIARPWVSLSVVGNLILVESLLSVDNAAVLANMVLDLPKQQRSKALKFGIVGAYVFRGLSLLFASLLLKIWWLKPLGGVYLLYLAIKFWRTEKPQESSYVVIEKSSHPFFRFFEGRIGKFWATVFLVEAMDLAFSIDNVFAAVAFSQNLILIWCGVFVGILAMRFVAQGFVRLMERFPFLETCAYLVIALLGLKLSASAFTHFYPCHAFSQFLEGSAACLESTGKRNSTMVSSHIADSLTTAFTLSIFFIPLATSLLFNWPKRQQPTSNH